MMHKLFVENFFDLSSFRHASLFARDEFVWEAIKRLESYIKTVKLGVIDGEIDKGAYLVDKHLISIGKGTIVEPGAYIRGPCYIGKNCTVRHGAYIRGNVLTGDNCIIGHDSELKSAIMLDHAHAPHFAYVGDSILGNRVNLGAGTILANLRFDGQDIVVRCDGKSYPTGLRKMGAILGDDVQTGCHTVANPGAILGKNARSWPGSNVQGVIPANGVVRNTETCDSKK